MSESVSLSYPVWLSYGVGHVLNDLCASIWFTYTLLFFEFVLELDSSLAGAAVVIGQVADGFSTPIIGIISDIKFDHWICKYGRRKTWHLLGTIFVACSFPFIFSPYIGFSNLTPTEQLLYYSVFIILFQIGWASVQISHLSLVPDLTPAQSLRTSLITIRYTFTVLSSIVVYIIFLAVLHFKANKMDEDDVLGPQDKYKFQLLAFIIVIIGVIMSIFFHIGVKERSIQDSNEESTTSSRLSVFRDPKIYAVICIYVSSRMFTNISQMYIPYYIQTYLKLLSKKLAILPLVMYISSFLTSIVIKQVNVEFGRKITFLSGSIIGLLACLWVQVGRSEDTFFKTYEIYGIVASFGCASAILLVTSLGITADLIGQNTDNGAFYYGVISFADKISNGLVVWCIENLKIENDADYYKNALIITCATFVILGTVVTLFQKLPGSTTSALSVTLENPPSPSPSGSTVS